MGDMMRNLTKSYLAGAALAVCAAVTAAPSFAVEAKIYPYAVSTHENYCPAGLQPITLSGVVCCGVPNQAHTYQQVMRHPVHKVRHKPVSYSARPDCREGEKGCS
ncbi:hypothetical protein [Roseovarius aquimarinus]|uniref:Secreted protein n=1 Tax=Roseovarius aquimarinus TaxID=1229156 RepID=A0ABW7I3U4_9RHOB